MSKPNLQYTIRTATPKDGNQLVAMVQALNIHLGESLDTFSKEQFLIDAFGSNPQFKVLVAAHAEGRLIGYALFHDSYETSFTERGVYLADLFVDATARGSGAGKQLLRAVAKDAKQRGRTFVWLVTPSEEARLFYNKIMNIEEKVVAYALAGDRFEEMVSDDS